jgi:putative ABC transport system ATP-binding protein
MPGIPSADGASGPAADGSDAAIRVSGVTRTFILGRRRVEALRGIDMLIDAPGFYAIMGASGSGKSTLLHLLAGLDRPTGGSLEVAGHRLEAMTESALTRYRRTEVGIVFQQFNLISTLTALENITLPLMLDGRPSRERNARGERLLAELGLTARAAHRPEALSGGEQQRVAIARALAFEPAILFADEPTGNLDSATSEALWRLLGELAERRRMIVLMVTHEPVAAAHCRRVFVLRDGRVAGILDTEGIDASDLATRAQQLGR